jgi:hypothetical protein
MTQTLLAIAQQKALDAQRDALAAQALWQFYKKHKDVLDNEANTNFLKEACGPDDLTLSALEFVYANSEKLQRQLSRHSERELADLTAEEARAAYQKLRGMTPEELRAKGAAEQRERLTQLSKLGQVNQVPAELTRAVFKAMSAADMKKTISKYGGKELNAAWSERE